MANATMYSQSGEQQGNVDLPNDLFAVDVCGHAMYESVKSYLANQRQGTHKTKNRHERAGQKTKMYRQKGTGRARAGSATAGNRVGGGRIFGPRPRDYRMEIPRKIRRLALKSALTDRAGAADVFVVEDFAMDKPSTKQMAGILGGMGLSGRRTLFVGGQNDTNLVKSARNIPGLEVIPANELNAYQVLRSDVLVVMKSALNQMEEVFAG